MYFVTWSCSGFVQLLCLYDPVLSFCIPVCPEVTIRNSIVKGETSRLLFLKRSCFNTQLNSLCYCRVFAISGFDMMEAFGLTEKAHSSVEGVAAEPFVFNSLPTYTLYRDTQLTQSTK